MYWGLGLQHVLGGDTIQPLAAALSLSCHPVRTGWGPEVCGNPGIIDASLLPPGAGALVRVSKDH